MIKTDLKDKYLVGKPPTAFQNEFSTFRKMYYDKETQVMANQSINEFYTWFLFKIDALPQDIVLMLDIDTVFLKNFIPEIR